MNKDNKNTQRPININYNVPEYITNIYIYIYIHTQLYIYIYIYRERERDIAPPCSRTWTATATAVRGKNRLSDATCLTHVFFRRGESCSKLHWPY